MASVGLVGTKMAAPAAMAANKTAKTFAAELEKMFAAAEATDVAEDARFGEARGDEPPAVLRGRTDRCRRFQAAKELLDAELALECEAHEAHLADRAAKKEASGKKLPGRKPKAPGDKAGQKEKKVNTTDPESKVMSALNGFLQGFNAQAVANPEQVVVAAEVTDEQNDAHQLHPMIGATQASLDDAGIAERFEKLLADADADAGYASEENFTALGKDDPDAYVATRNMKNNPAARTGRRGPPRKDTTSSSRWTARSRTRPDAPYIVTASSSSSGSSARSRMLVTSAGSCGGAKRPRRGVEAHLRHP